MKETFYKKTRIKNGNRGQILMFAVVSFTILALIIVVGLISPIIRQVQIVRDFQLSKQSYFTAEAGAEDAFYRIKNNMTTVFPETLTLATSTATVTTSTIGSNEQEIFSEGNDNNLIRDVVKDIAVTDGFEFNFAVQVGPGGLTMHNLSTVIGNVYSAGPILGDSNNSNIILGDAVSTGSSGSVSTVHATSSVYAHTISNSVIDKNAYYQVIDAGTTVGGTKFPGSADQTAASMPIPDSLLDKWESDAVAGGTSNTCPYNISSNVTLGPKKINCDVTVSGNSTVVTLVGAVWINGNLTINNNPEFKVIDSTGDKSIPIVVDSTSNPTTKGVISVNNNPTFIGSISNGVPNPDSYVMLISRNTSAENSGVVTAISAGNNVNGNLLLYAPHGAISLSNNVLLREVTGYSLTLYNNTQVHYSTGLGQALFTTGPGGKWTITRWRETIR